MQRFREEKGFTLIEVLITLLIIGVVFTPLLVYFNNSVVYTIEAGKRSQAIKLANNTMENIRLAASRDWSELDFEAKKNYLDVYIDKAKYSLLANDYIINLEASASLDLDEDGNEDGKLVTVKVFWDNKKKSIELSSLVMK